MTATDVIHDAQQQKRAIDDAQFAVAHDAARQLADLALQNVAWQQQQRGCNALAAHYEALQEARQWVARIGDEVAHLIAESSQNGGK